MQNLASWSVDVRYFFIGRFKEFDKLMKRNQFHKVCNRFLK
jgi:hypothetical protein